MPGLTLTQNGRSGTVGGMSRESSESESESDREEEVEVSRPMTRFNVCVFTSKSGETATYLFINRHNIRSELNILFSDS